MSANNLAGKAGNFFKELGKRFKFLGEGIGGIIKGIGEEFIGVIEGSFFWVNDLIGWMITVFVFGGTNIICFIELLGNFKQCILYYLLNIILEILYIPVRIIIWILITLGIINLQPFLDKFSAFVEKIDQVIYRNCKFHIVHYPKSVREKCFVCKRLKPQVLIDVALDFATDLTPMDGRIINPLARGILTMIGGGEKLGYVFSPWP
jgi:hypothetical protein